VTARKERKKEIDPEDAGALRNGQHSALYLLISTDQVIIAGGNTKKKKKKKKRSPQVIFKRGGKENHRQLPEFEPATQTFATAASQLQNSMHNTAEERKRREKGEEPASVQER